VPRNLLVGSAICVVVVTFFWIFGIWPSLLGRFGVKLLAGGGLIVPAAGAVLSVLSFSRAGRLKRWAVGLAAVNVAYCAAYFAFILA
jgi:hypothetical protein